MRRFPKGASGAMGCAKPKSADLGQPPSSGPVPDWMQLVGWTLVIVANSLMLYRYFVKGEE